MMKTSQRGMTLAEVLMAMAILSVLIFASISVTSSAMLASRNNIDKQFATQKALSMLEELKSLAQGAQGRTVVILDQYDDGTAYKPNLTIQNNVQPADPISGNTANGTSWLYSRQISVLHLGQTQGGVRLVRVRVYKNENGGQRLLAEVSSVIRTISTVMPTTQVYDVYCVAVENVPGWWVYTSSLVSFVQNAIADLQARNPGLEFRIHWITRLSYGRDQQYTASVNNLNDTYSDINWVYFYPGTLPQNNSTANPPNLAAYYPVGTFNAHINVDGTEQHDYVATAPGVTANNFPYALADQYNHAMRYYDEKAWNANRIADKTDTEPTYRILLDDMIMNPAKYTNAILINLHGELFPFPPIRNYSDAAKDPEQTANPDLTNIRVVTHPENLAYDTATNINLRVYAWEAPYEAKSSVTDANAFLPSTGANATAITVVLKGLDLSGAVSFRRIEGGTRQLAATAAGHGDAYQRSGFGAIPADVTNPNRMYATVAYRNPDTLITLYNTPYRAPFCQSTNGLDCGGAGNDYGGLSETYLLYGMQYIPAPMENFASATAAIPFGTDLAVAGAGANVAKNTARWVIQINAANLNTALTNAGLSNNRALTIETRIGLPPVSGIPTTGVLYPTANHPANLSRTYVWRGTDLWLNGDGTDANPPNLPLSERIQFIGDPRHNPYADNKKPHSTGTFNAANESRNGMGYDRYFDDFESPTVNTGGAGGAWQGWTYTVGGTNYGVKNDGNATNDGWTTGGGQIELDIPRAYQMVRTALTSSRAIYTTMTGYSYYYIGVGGEIGYDAANQFPNSIPLSSKPFTGTGGQSTEQSIINDGTVPAQGAGVKYVQQSGGGTNYWWAIPWLGELYPDSAYLGANGWQTKGNLTTGTTATDFLRVIRGAIGPTGGAGAGTVATTGGSPNVTGTGTSFTTQLAPGRLISIGTQGTYLIGSITDNTHLVLTSNATATAASLAYTAPIPPTGTGTLSTTNGSANVVGSGTTFTTQLVVGQRISVSGQGADYISAITDNTHMTLATNATVTAANLAFTYGWTPVWSLPAGTDFNGSAGSGGNNAVRRTNVMGCTTFFSTGTSGSTFHHAPNDSATSTLITEGLDIAAATSGYNFTLLNPIPSSRPFSNTINNTGANPEAGAAWVPPYGSIYLPLAGVNTDLWTAAGQTFTVAQQAEFYQQSASQPGSALNSLRDPLTNKVAFVAVNGLSPTGATGSQYIARWSFLSLIHSYFLAGLYTDATNCTGCPFRVQQLPRVLITSPAPSDPPLNNPSTVSVTFSTAWTRWDTQKYTPAYSNSFSETSTMQYQFLYSADNGVTWKYNDGSTAATPGTKLTSGSGILTLSGSSPYTFTWNTPAASFPAGNYIIRVEAYRASLPLHYAYHQYRAYIQRP